MLAFWESQEYEADAFADSVPYEICSEYECEDERPLLEHQQMLQLRRLGTIRIFDGFNPTLNREHAIEEMSDVEWLNQLANDARPPCEVRMPTPGIRLAKVSHDQERKGSCVRGARAVSGIAKRAGPTRGRGRRGNFRRGHETAGPTVAPTAEAMQRTLQLRDAAAVTSGLHGYPSADGMWCTSLETCGSLIESLDRRLQQHDFGRCGLRDAMPQGALGEPHSRVQVQVAMPQLAASRQSATHPGAGAAYVHPRFRRARAQPQAWAPALQAYAAPPVVARVISSALGMDSARTATAIAIAHLRVEERLRAAALVPSGVPNRLRTAHAPHPPAPG